MFGIDLKKEKEGVANGAEMEPSPAVKIDNVWKNFGSTTVLTGLNMHIADGERVAIIGPSGSGKSTLLRLVAILDTPSKGRIELFGQPVPNAAENGHKVPKERDLRSFRANTGFVFQHFNLFPHMTALSNVAEAPRRVLRESKSAAIERARTLLDNVGLGDKADMFPAQLSGGQQQRVAIARALAMKPQIMLFDEVTSALDPELVGEVLGVLRKIARETRMTMLFVTHEMRFARDVADRVVFMDDGMVIESGPPEKIFECPEHPRTKSFLRALFDER